MHNNICKYIHIIETLTMWGKNETWKSPWSFKNTHLWMLSFVKASEVQAGFCF